MAGSEGSKPSSGSNEGEKGVDGGEYELVPQHLCATCKYEGAHEKERKCTKCSTPEPPEKSAWPEWKEK